MSELYRPRVLAVIQAGGKGSRLDLLTRETPKPALPFAGSYRMIDFVLSNLRNSDISDVWLAVQYQGQQLAEAVGNGKPWDLDRHHGGFKLLLPEQSGAPADEGFAGGNAEQLFQSRDVIRSHGADVVLVLSADHVYRLDYRTVIEHHLARQAECTVVTTVIDRSDASHHALVTTDGAGRVTDFADKPDHPDHGTVATEVFVYSPEPLIEVLEELHRTLGADPDEDDGAEDGSSLGDFGQHLLPALVRRGKTHAFPLHGYWRDLGRPETYFAAHQELLQSDLGLFSAEWPVITNSTRSGGGWLHSGANVSNSLVSAGCHIHGTVRDSILGPGVTVAAGASVRNSILFEDVRIGQGADVGYSIIDRRCQVASAVKVGRRSPTDEPGADDLTLIGADSIVDHDLPRGSRLEPGSTT